MGKHDNCPGWTKTDDTGGLSSISEYPIESPAHTHIIYIIYSFFSSCSTNWMRMLNAALLWITKVGSSLFRRCAAAELFLILFWGSFFGNWSSWAQLNQPMDNSKRRKKERIINPLTTHRPSPRKKKWEIRKKSLKMNGRHHWISVSSFYILL